ACCEAATFVGASEDAAAGAVAEPAPRGAERRRRCERLLVVVAVNRMGAVEVEFEVEFPAKAEGAGPAQRATPQRAIPRATSVAVRAPTAACRRHVVIVLLMLPPSIHAPRDITGAV